MSNNISPNNHLPSRTYEEIVVTIDLLFMLDKLNIYQPNDYIPQNMPFVKLFSNSFCLQCSNQIKQFPNKSIVEDLYNTSSLYTC